MSFPANNWYSDKNIFFSPQPNTARLDPIKQTVGSGSGVKTKQTSKLSTKSPHAITGHKFSKGKTPLVSKTLKQSFFTNYSSKTPPVSNGVRRDTDQTFEQVSEDTMNESNGYRQDEDPSKAKSEKSMPMFKDPSLNFIRKST